MIPVLPENHIRAYAIFVAAQFSETTVLTGIPRMTPNWREYLRFSGLVARLTRRGDGYQQLGQPERWSRG